MERPATELAIKLAALLPRVNDGTPDDFLMLGIAAGTLLKYERDAMRWRAYKRWINDVSKDAGKFWEAFCHTESSEDYDTLFDKIIEFYESKGIEI